MTRSMKLVLPIVAGLMLSFNISHPAQAQFAGGGGFEQMEQFAPMLEMMKKKLGKKRFAMLMQTFGPMMSQMAEGQNGGFAGFGGDNGFNVSAMGTMMNPEMIAGMTQMFNAGHSGKKAQRHHNFE
jgi:hypothetical protein